MRNAITHLLHAIANRIDPKPPEPVIQYVYLYTPAPSPTFYPTYPSYPTWYSSPTITSEGNTCLQ